MVAHKKSKKKSKKQHGAAGETNVNGFTIHAKIIDNETDYPTTRVIKRAPNGDVIVEPLPDQTGETGEDLQPAPVGTAPAAEAVEEDHGSKWPLKLDSHWESLSLEERRNILRISKDELFDMVKSYKNVNGCDCNMCGRNNNMNLEEEMEHIYFELYAAATREDPGTDFVQFHLKLIKEYQKNSSSKHILNSNNAATTEHNGHKQETVEALVEEAADDSNELPNYESSQEIPMECRNDFVSYLSRDSDMSYCLSEDINEAEHQHTPGVQGNLDNEVEEEEPTAPASTVLSSPLDWKREIEQFKSSKQRQAVEAAPDGCIEEIKHAPSSSKDSAPHYYDLDSRLLHFAKTFVSTHPHIAEEFISKAMMYPHIKALTEDMMTNEGEGLKRAMESLVLQQQFEGESIAELTESDEAVNSETSNKVLESQTASSTDEAEKPSPEDSSKSNVLRTDNGKLVLAVPEKSSATPSLNRNELDSLVDKMSFDFVSNPESISSLKNAFYDVFDNKTKRRQIDLDDKQYKEELERLRNEISADEDQESYEWSNDDDYDDEAHDSKDQKFIEDEGVVNQLESNYGATNGSIDTVYEHSNIKSDLQGEIPRDRLDMKDMDIVHQSEGSHIQQSEDELEDEYEDVIDQAERLEEGKRLIQIAITKLLQKKLVASYQIKEAEKNRERLLMELEAEENQKKEKERKKQQKKEKEKEKKRQQQLAREEEKRRQQEEEIRLKKAAEEKELARREAQRQKVEEAKRKNDEKLKKKLAEQRRREEEQERSRKEKEEMKRQRDEELKQKRSEKEKMELEREQQKLEQERIKKQSHSLPSNEPVALQSQDLPLFDSSAYQSSLTESLHPNATVDDDIFSMINEASKSMSSSPPYSRNMVHQPLLPESSDLLNLPSNNSFMQPGPSGGIPLPQVSLNVQSGVTPLVPTMQQGSLGGWEQQTPSQSYYKMDNNDSFGLSTIGTSKYPQFSDNTQNGTNDINEITNFLKETSLDYIPGVSSGALHTSPLSNAEVSSRPQSAVYNRKNMWANDPSQVANGFSQQQASQPPQIPSLPQPRRSIWDSGVDSTFPSDTTNSFRGSIWGPPQDMQSATNTIPHPAPTDPSTSNFSEIILKGYNLISPDNSFVPLDKLYQASLTQMNGQSMSYLQFMSSLMSMKNSHNVELLNDNTGLLAYCRIGAGPTSNLLPSYSPSPYAAIPAQLNTETQQAPSRNPLLQPSNSLFNDLTYAPSDVAPPQDAKSVAPSSSSSFINMGQPFTDSFQPSNIWG